MFLKTCSSALCPFPRDPDMPIDVALPLFLFPPSPPPSPAFQPQKPKKRVTFADHRGLSLTRVKLFSRLSDPVEIPARLALSTERAARSSRLLLDFAQPSSDYLRFRQSLERNLVSLERCELRDDALTGTVRVKNVSFEKSVKLRVTFDAWRSHGDHPCEYVRDDFPGAHGDTFAFRVELPAGLRRAEFAVCYSVDGREHWDSNDGRNYNVVRSEDASRPEHLTASFDRYGSPTCSHGILPDWPSYVGYVGPYY